MTFGLKNAGATYQRSMNYIFHELIGKMMEIYINDVAVKSEGYQEHLSICANLGVHKEAWINDES